MTATRRCCSARRATSPRRAISTAPCISSSSPPRRAFGGGRVMVEEGLFDKFPCDAVFGMHNKPGIPVGHIATRAGPMLAASDRFDIRIKAQRRPRRAPASRQRPVRGRRADRHGAADHRRRATSTRSTRRSSASALCAAARPTTSSRTTCISAAPRAASARRCATCLERRMSEIVRGTAALHGAEAALDYRRGYPPTINHAAEAASRPMSRPRSAARSMSSATSRPRWAARISRTCCWRGRAR